MFVSRRSSGAARSLSYDPANGGAVWVHLNRKAWDKELGRGDDKRTSTTINFTTGEQAARGVLQCKENDEDFKKEVRLLDKVQDLEGVMKIYSRQGYQSEKRKSKNEKFITKYEIIGKKYAGDLSAKIFARNLTVNEKIKMIGFLLKTLEEIHAKNIAHRDLAPRNIFLTEDNRPIIW